MIPKLKYRKYRLGDARLSTNPAEAMIAPAMVVARQPYLFVSILAKGPEN